MAEEPKPSFLGAKPAAPSAPAASAASETPSADAPAESASPTGPVKKASFFNPKAAQAAAAPAAKSGLQAAAPAAAKGKSGVIPAPKAPAPPPVAVPVLAPGDRASAEQHLQNGLNFYDAQDVNNALQAYQLCVQADPSFGMGHNNLGMVLIDLERYDEAVAALYNSVRCDANYAEAYNNLGFVLRRMQRPLEACSAYARFLEIEPDVEEGDRIRGWVATILAENNLGEAPPFQLPGAAPAAPTPAEPPPKLKKMAAWEVAAGNTATAAPVSVLGEIGPVAQTPVQPSQVAPMQPPQSPPVGKPAPRPPAKPPTSGGPGAYVQLIEKGLDQFAQSNLDEAAATFQQAIAMTPGNAEGYTGLGKVLIRQERLTEAVEQLQKAVELDPEDPAPYYVLGFSLRALERNVEAAESYQVYLRLMPNALDADRMRQWVGLVLGADAAGIVEPIEEAADDEPISTDTDAKYKLALDHFQAGECDGAERECVALLTADPGHYRTRLLLGRCYLRQKKLDAAIEQFQNVLISRPDYPEALYFLGQSHDKIGDAESAKENYQRYLDIAPTGARAQRVEDWFLARGQSKSGTGGEQQQCDLCLRFFGPTEITQHEGKATCVNCMAVMGGAPIMPAPPSSQKAGALAVRKKPGTQDDEDEQDFVAVPKRSNSFALLAVVGGIVVLGGVAFALGFLDPVLKAVGLGPKNKPKPPVVIPGPGPGPIEPEGPFDFKKIKLTGEPPKTAAAFATWHFAPKLEGYEGIEVYTPGWTKTFSLKGGPQGMFVDPASGLVTWTPRSMDPDILKRGASYRVELEVAGRGKPVLQPEEQELFKLSLPFTVGVQFAYELGAEMDLGIGPTDFPALVGGDFNADGLADLAAGTGSFRSGGMSVYIQRKNSPLGTPTFLDKTGRFASVAVGDVDGDKHDDLIGAAWMTGKLKLFKQTGADVVASGEVLAGLGPVATTLCDMDNDGKTETAAAILSSTGTLAVATLDPSGKFGPIKTIPVRSGGPRAYLFPYKSLDAGPGLIAVLPLAQSPIQFIPYSGGNWGAPVATGLEQGNVIRAVAVLKSPGGLMRLALLTASKTTSRVVVMREKNGKFTPVGEPQTLPVPGVGLLASDFNGDGDDDLLVIENEELEFSFAAANDEWITGYRVKSPKLLGPGAIMSVPSAKGVPIRPDALLIGDNRKGHFLRPVINEPPPPPDAVAPAPAAAGAPDAGSAPEAPKNPEKSPAKKK